MNYLHWDEKTIPSDSSEKDISAMYDRGYVFTRIGKGVMHQTRSVRIDLSKFELSSENRRILNKVEGLELRTLSLSLKAIKEYDWSIGKLAKDFYEEKFGHGIMSAQKIKELLVDSDKSNFNSLFTYTPKLGSSASYIGYAICYSNAVLLHYSYPFYDLNLSPKDMGLAMMIRAIEYAKRSALKYIYLGSLQRPGDTYKLQFTGLEWFDGGPGGSNKWSTEIEAVKAILKPTP